MRAATWRALSLALSCAGAAACGGATGAREVKSAPEPHAAGAASAPVDSGAKSASAPGAASGARAPDSVDEGDPETRALVRAVAEKVSKARGLPVKREVKSRELARPGMLERIKAQVEKDQPMEEVARQGEILVALELVPPEYDFVAGTFRLIEGQIAGFYTPDDQTMYLADDLSEREAEETLAHELVHALQDQSFDLGSLLKYAPGQSDRAGAIHAIAEGDAMSAMLDVTAGSAFNVSEAALRRIMAISTAMTTAGAATPRVLQSALIAPYADGFAFVQALRRRGGWKAVDEAWRAMPATTEQLLHIDKYDAREPAIPMPPITIAGLGDGWKQAIDDGMGEQGLRIVLEAWTHLRDAAAGAAGWGGDRYVVARRESSSGPGGEELAVAWSMRFDSTRDADEVAAILGRKFGGACVVRGAQGPITWKEQGDAIALVAGPYERRGRALTATGACSSANAWRDSILKSMKTSP